MLIACVSIMISAMMLFGGVLPAYAADGVWIHVNVVSAWKYKFDNATQTYFKMRYFHKEADSQITEYKTLIEDAPCEGSAEQLVQSIDTAGTFSLGKWTSEPLPGRVIPGGDWGFKLWTTKTGATGEVYIFTRVYKREGASETQLAESTQGTVPQYPTISDVLVTADFPETFISEGTRIVVEVLFNVATPQSGRNAYFAYDNSTYNSRAATTEGSYRPLVHVGWASASAKGTGIEGTAYFDGPWGTQTRTIDITNSYVQTGKRDLSTWGYPPRKQLISVAHPEINKPTDDWVAKVYAKNTNDTISTLEWYQAVIPSEWVQSANDITAYINGSTDGVFINPNIGNWTLIEGYSWQLGYYVSMFTTLSPSQTLNFTIVLNLSPTLTNPGWTPYSVLTSFAYYASGSSKVYDVPDLPLGDTGLVRPDLTYKTGESELDTTYASVMEQIYVIILPDPPTGDSDSGGRGGGNGNSGGGRGNSGGRGRSGEHVKEKVMVLRILPNGKENLVEVPREALRGVMQRHMSHIQVVPE